MKIFKKTTSSIILLSFTFSSLIISLPHQATAQLTPAPGIQVPVADTFNLPFHMFAGNKDGFFDAILYVAMKSLASSLTASVVDWINSGFDGNPAFVVNEGLFLNQAHDLVFESFAAGEIPAIYENSGFDSILVRTLAQDYISSLRDSNTYNLDEHVIETDAFLAGEFTKGGLSGFYQLTQNPKNNYYGALYESEKELDDRISVISQSINTELNRGDGFFSLRDELGNVLTPGQTIESQLETVLGSGIRQLELADEFNEIVGALISQLATRALSSTGLAGTNAPTSAGSSFIDQLLDDDVEQANPNDVLDTGVINTGTPGVTEGGVPSGDPEAIHCFEITQTTGSTQGTNSNRGSLNLGGEDTEETIDTRCSSSLAICNEDRQSFSVSNTNVTIGACREL